MDFFWNNPLRRSDNCSSQGNRQELEIFTVTEEESSEPSSHLNKNKGERMTSRGQLLRFKLTYSNFVFSYNEDCRVSQNLCWIVQDK